MFQVITYKDRQGNDEIFDYISELGKKAKSSKSERIILKKIIEYIKVLESYGSRVGEPYIKHIDGDVWELRPSNNRIFFFYWKDNTFVLLHYFVKQTKKTPPGEIEKAKKNLNDFIERNGK